RRHEPGFEFLKEQPCGRPGPPGGPVLGLGETFTQGLQPTLRQILHGRLLYEILMKLPQARPIDNGASRYPRCPGCWGESRCHRECLFGGVFHRRTGPSTAWSWLVAPVLSKTAAEKMRGLVGFRQSRSFYHFTP